jgi:putative ABC transport system permease protein
MGLQLIAGRNFNPAEKKLNKHNIIINEQAVKKFNFTNAHDAVDEVLYSPQDSSQYRIIGVIKDYNHQVLMDRVDAMALRYDSASFRLLQVKYSGSHAQAVESIEAAWSKINPTLKIDHRDLDEEIHAFYKMLFSDLVSVVGVISFLAIAISCLGLLGMATYAIEIRQKEISIRKVLGSGNRQLVVLLSKGFVWLLLIAIAIAVPIAWFINDLWLQHIAYRTPLGVTVIGGGIGIVFLLGAVTIGSQTLKAALANPVDALKNE